jgi:ribosomal protein L11 methyltransferase
MTGPSSWWEIQVCCPLWLEDAIAWRLDEFGCRGTASEVVSGNHQIRAYIHQAQADIAQLEWLRSQLQADANAMQAPDPVSVQWHLIQEEDWAQTWKQYWHPQDIGDRLLIHPAWLPLPTQTKRLVLQLDPGVAFGTGNHPTTQMCLEALETMILQKGVPAAIADVGCGSGILSIAAALLSAKQIYAVDPDPLAVTSTLSNWQLNQLPLEQLTVCQGSVEQLIQNAWMPVDGIVCNILAPVIIELMPQLSQIAHAKSWMILSGLLTSQASLVLESAGQYGWTCVEQRNQGDWSGLIVQRSFLSSSEKCP